MKLEREYTPLVYTDVEKCVNCHACIAVCPVKYCNNANSDQNAVTIDPALCIACGECVKACQHGARINTDDTTRFFGDLQRGEKIVAIVAPAIAANFPDDYMRINGWLKSRGVEAVFDVSFGAELTVKSYLHVLDKEKPQTLIAQPCPVIVKFIETYQPDLLPYLSPADSPMAHIMKMIRKYYPNYRNHKIAAISPCVAKKREFEAIGFGDYNVTMKELRGVIKKDPKSLSSYPELDYDNPEAERAVMFSSPGGLLKTIERWNPDASNITRKIEGPAHIYGYLEKLSESIKNKCCPILIDCLNCELGCNGGTGTDMREGNQDSMETSVKKRAQKLQERYSSKGKFFKHNRKQLDGVLDKFWEEGLYVRKYEDRSEHSKRIKDPDKAELKVLMESMGKYSQDDIHNCAACGYGTCEGMAKALHNGINKPENCHFYKADKMMTEQVSAQFERNMAIARNVYGAAENLDQQLNVFSSSMEEMSASIREISVTTRNAYEITQKAHEVSDNSNVRFEEMMKASNEVKMVLGLIQSTAGKLNLLALNATIEAASAGNAGKGFAVVAGEVKELARSTAQATQQVGKIIENMDHSSKSVRDALSEIAEVIDQIRQDQSTVASAIDEQSATTDSLAKSTQAAYDTSKVISSQMEELTREGESKLKSGV